LIQGSDGNFYGTTLQGGSSASATSFGAGTIFKITPGGSLTTLHSFSGSDGHTPSGVAQAADGNFYGITQYGGAGNCPASPPLVSGCGTIFQVTAGGTFTSLHSFNVTDGTNPSSLIPASDGNLYGTTTFGGAGSCPGVGGPIDSGCGTIFKITPEGSLTTLYSFGMNNSNPSSLIQAIDGNFYGLTLGGPGQCFNCGTIFKMTPEGSLTMPYTFDSNGTDVFSANSLLSASDGNIYGTTTSGGANGVGAVFEFSLAPPDTPAIATNGGVLNGASFQPGIAADSWMTINGTNLSTKTDTWSNAIVNGALPTTLDGVSVMVGDQPAYMEYVSSTQINALAPSVPAGTVPVTVTNGNGTSQAVMAEVSAAQPAFFQWGTYAVATRQNFSLAVKNGTFPGTTTVPAKPGDVIILWGTGFGLTSPSAPAGVETPTTTTYNTASTVSVTVGKKPATVYGAALAPGYAGLYQIAIQIPALANGDYPVVATINGALSPSTTMMTVQQ
jgi:uncharacterized protein (TIGR03437 family)